MVAEPWDELRGLCLGFGYGFLLPQNDGRRGGLAVEFSEYTGPSDVLYFFLSSSSWDTSSSSSMMTEFRPLNEYPSNTSTESSKGG
jgi:hypothetical protein